MAGDPIFMDTAALLALASKRDSFHAEAVKVRDRITREDSPVITSEWVLTEFLICFPNLT